MPNPNPEHPIHAHGRVEQAQERATALEELVDYWLFVKQFSKVGLSATNENENVDRSIDRATEVIGDKERAMRWLGTPVRALNYATPISILGTDEGVRRIEETLGRLEHGLF